jgi:hypothetical protein
MFDLHASMLSFNSGPFLSTMSQRKVLPDSPIDVSFANPRLMLYRRFLWVKFQLDDLCTAETDGEILDMLQHLPFDLRETYDRLLGRIAGRHREQLIRRMFEWIICAKRPLHVDELQEAIAFSLNDDHWDSTKIPNDMARLIRACGNLVVIDEDSSIVQFAHYTVEQYILSAPKTFSWPLRFSLQQAKTAVAGVCLAYLSFSDFESQVIKHWDNTGANMAAIEAMVTSNSVLPREQLANMALSVWEHVRPQPKRRSGNTQYGQYITKRSPPTDDLVAKYKMLPYVVDFWLIHSSAFDGQLDESTQTYKLFHDLLFHKTLQFDGLPWEASILRKGQDLLRAIPALGWGMENDHPLLIKTILGNHGSSSKLVGILLDAVKAIFGDLPPSHVHEESTEKLATFTQQCPNALQLALPRLYSMFLTSVRLGHTRILALFIPSKSAIRDEKWMTGKAYEFLCNHALVIAAMHSHLELVRMLLWRTYSPITIQYHSMDLNALGLAAFRGNKDIVLLLQDLAPSFTFNNAREGVKALVGAIRDRNTPVIEGLETAIFGRNTWDLDLRLWKCLSDVLDEIRPEDETAAMATRFLFRKVAQQKNWWNDKLDFEVAALFVRVINWNSEPIMEGFFKELWPLIRRTEVRRRFRDVAKRGQVCLVKLFLQYLSLDGMESSKMDAFLQTPLLAAASSRNHSVAKVLVEYAPSIINYTVLDNRTGSAGGYECDNPAIYQAAKTGDFEAVDMLVSADIQSSLDCLLSYPPDDSPLHTALLSRHHHTSRRLIEGVLGLERGSSWGVNDDRWDYDITLAEKARGISLLKIAIDCGNIPIIQLLLKGGAFHLEEEPLDPSIRRWVDISHKHFELILDSP